MIKLQKMARFYPSFAALYREYIAELSRYSLRIQSEPVTHREVLKMMANKWLERWLIKDDIYGVIGFCLIGFGPNKHPDADWYIAEFFIKSEFQRKQYGIKAIEALFALHTGVYCYFVLTENIPAQKFWAEVQKRYDCVNRSDLKCATTPNDCQFGAFFVANNGR